MSTSQRVAAVKAEYEEAAQTYLNSLKVENIMEARAQGQQRAVTLASLALVRHRRPEVHVYNEMLVQYRAEKGPPIRQVVPDNMVVLYDGELTVEGSFNLPLQPERPFWVLEYVSRHNIRKDYEDNFGKYEKELKVPYYLLFYPDDQELSLYHLRRARYVSIKPNAHGRLAIPQIDVEVALHDGWVRYWFRGALLPLPAELQQQVDDANRQMDILRRENEAKDREIERLRAQLDRLRGA
jgi:Uma2 family endonuclease